MSRRHGIPSTYNEGCRCNDCRECNRLRHQRLRARLQARTDVPHGTYSGYQNWSCRCDQCVQANADHRAGIKTRVGAVSKRGPWSEEELRLAARYDLTAVQIARRLGRSYASVTGARHRLAREAEGHR